MSKINSTPRFLIAIAVLLMLFVIAAVQMSAYASVTASSRSTGATTPAVSPLATSSPWIAATPLPATVYLYAFATDIDQNFYVIGGLSTDGISSAVRQYDPFTDNWTILRPMPDPTGREAAAAVYYNGNIYVAGGRNNSSANRPDTYADTLYIYNIATNTWSTGAPMTVGVEAAAIGAYDNKVYVAGGYNNYPTSMVQVYDTVSGVWSHGPSAPAPIAYAGYTQVGQYLYVVGGGGNDTNNNSTATMRLDMTNMAPVPWSWRPSFTQARAELALASDGVNLYAIGGTNDGPGAFNPSAEVDQYPISQWPNGSWSALPSNYYLPTPRQRNSAGFFTTAHNGEIWSVGGLGINNNNLTDNLYLPISSLPTPTPPGPTPTTGPTNTPGPPTPTLVCPIYTDIPCDYWAFSYIHSLSSRGIVSGYPDNTFRPGAQITRAEFTKMVMIGFGKPITVPAGASYTDVPSGYWAYNYIGSAANQGIITGYSSAQCQAVGLVSPCFRPNQPVNRAEMVTILVNTAPISPYTPSSGNTYPDVPPSHWAYNSIETATYYQWISGYPGGLFLPNADSTRAEMSKVLYLAIAPQAKPGK